MTNKVDVAELHNRINNLEQAIENLERKCKKADILLKMSRGTVKQMERDKQAARWIYDDIIENMMNRQVMMAAAGWDKYRERKKKQDAADPTCP